MKTLGLTQTFADHSVYIYECCDSVIFIPLYVDNLLIRYCDYSKMECIKSSLEHHFKMVDAGPTSWVLGMQVTNDPTSRCISLNQTQYILKVIKKFGMADCKPALTPLPEKMVLHAASDDEAHEA